MRTITYGGAVSLDGFLAGADGAIDWIHYSPDVQRLMAAYWKGVDCVLMGRRTYEAARAMAKEAARDGRKAPAVPQTYVCSRTLAGVDDPAATLVRDAVPFVRDLKAREGGAICLMGGGELARSLLEAGVVDEVGLNVHPVLLGAGVPAFRDPRHRVGLRLLDCQRLDGGCVYLKYAVAQA